MWQLKSTTMKLTKYIIGRIVPQFSTGFMEQQSVILDSSPIDWVKSWTRRSLTSGVIVLSSRTQQTTAAEDFQSQLSHPAADGLVVRIIYIWKNKNGPKIRLSNLQTMKVLRKKRYQRSSGQVKLQLRKNVPNLSS